MISKVLGSSSKSYLLFLYFSHCCSHFWSLTMKSTDQSTTDPRLFYNWPYFNIHHQNIPLPKHSYSQEFSSIFVLMTQLWLSGTSTGDVRILGAGNDVWLKVFIVKGLSGAHQSLILLTTSVGLEVWKSAGQFMARQSAPYLKGRERKKNECACTCRSQNPTPVCG